MHLTSTAFPMKTRRSTVEGYADYCLLFSSNVISMKVGKSFMGVCVCVCVCEKEEGAEQANRSTLLTGLFG